MNISPLINMEMPTIVAFIVGIFIVVAEKISCSAERTRPLFSAHRITDKVECLDR